MFLRRLDLVGFKSFAVKTSAELLPGIVVVVGPNGSGKSNIADGLLWVLGEQSARAVRARKPEEVIFAGSASRQPLGMAEVSLVLDNSDNSLPIDFDEVRVTRRLFRSGDSEYLLNGSKVRLKDITQLLLHAGLSPDSYSVIGQGSIDELILQRPDERRVAFENVADIRRHQLRLNDTRSKLASTDANLVRVQDVLAELTPHVKRLKTQAERAGRADSFRAELHDLLVRWFRARLARAHQERLQAEGELRTATAETDDAVAATLIAETAMQGLDQRIAAIDERLAEIRPRTEFAREHIRNAERSLAVVRERNAGLVEQRVALEEELARLSGRRSTLQQEEQEAAAAAGETVAEDPPGEADELASRRAETAQATVTLETLRRERSSAQGLVAASEQRARETEARLARTEQHQQSLQAALAVDEARQSERARRIVNLEQQIETLQNEVATMVTRAEELRSRLQTTTAARAEAGSRLEADRETLRAASQQADRLQGALAALGAVDLDQRDDADLPPDWQTVLADLPVVGRARELAARIRPIDLLLGGYLQRIVVLATDTAAREAFVRLTQHLPRTGAAWAVLSMDGLLLAGEGERPLEAVGDTGQSILADWSRQVRQLEAERARAETSRRQGVAAVQSARDALDDAEATERSVRMALGDMEARLNELRRAHTTTVNELRQLRVEHDRSERAAAQRVEERVHSTARAETVREELASARAERDEHLHTLRRLDEQLAERVEQVNELRHNLAALEALAGRREAERAARQALYARIQAELAANGAAQGIARVRLDVLATQREELDRRATEHAAERARLTEQLDPLEQELLAHERSRLELLTERQATERQVADVRATERAARERREARHVAAQRAADDLDRLNAEITETSELEAELGGGATWAEQLRLDFEGTPTVPADVPPIDLDAARRRIATLQRELRAVGGVAESVVQEYREMSDRHSFLEQQSEDLRVAQAELNAAAGELETHMRERFAETFGQIQQAFQECFEKLFGGGEARLVLTDPDNLLRTGIEIVARPPGKKLQNLLSLSGGERALTVVSLLFGLLKINPTPFCVLDEVDAALDEANVQRFANLLGEFARQIQFIVVTHNRATMDKADAMYGISMDAQGISHIFSVQPRAIAAEPAGARA